MLPYIYLGPIEIPMYGVLALLGFTLGITLGVLRRKLYNISTEDAIFASLFAGIGIIVGAKLLYGLTNINTLINAFPDIMESGLTFDQKIMNMGIILFGGFVFYGGLIGAVIMAYIYCKSFKVNFYHYANMMVPSIPLIHGMGRIGCFLAGCCYGKEHHGFLAVQFPANEMVPELDDVTRYPVQLFEAGLNFILFGILYFYSRKKRKPGSSLGIYLICYTIIRFSLEHFRGDEIRGIFLGLSTSQWISILLVPIGFYLIFRKEKVKEN